MSTRVAVSTQITVDQSMVSARRVGTNEIGLPDWRLEGPNFGLETYTAASTAGHTNPKERGGFAMPMNHNRGALSTRGADGCSAKLQASPELLASLARRPAPDPELISGYMSGQITTRAAATGPNRAGRRFEGRFTKPRYQRSPDREKSIQRRRTLAATWPMPPAMCGKLTTGQIAYARIVADEIAEHGRCDRTLDEKAARAGICRKTAKRAQDRLQELGWITVEERPIAGRKNLPNVIRIVSDEWTTWIKMGPPPRRRSIGGHSCPTTGNRFFSKSATTQTEHGERPKGAWRGKKIARFVPQSGSS